VATVLPLMMISGPTARSPGRGCCGTGTSLEASSPQEKTTGLPGLPAGPVAALVVGPLAGVAG
jgi:hypothetical protein